MLLKIKKLRIKNKPSSTALFALLISTLSIPSFAQGMPGGLECRLLPPIMHGFLSHHVSVKKADSTLESRVAEQFIKRLDPSKVYLLESDVASIKNELFHVFDKINAGDCSGILKAQKLLSQRTEESAKQAKQILSSNFAFEPKTEVIIDPTKRQFPKTKEEAEQQLRKFLQFQVSNYLASDMKLPQAKKQLIHRYELGAKRNAETSSDDTFSLFLDAFASALDAHSSYLSRDVLEDFEISMRLSLEGIGTSLSWDDGYTTVESLVPGGAAEKSGEIKPKDKIIAVGQGKSGNSESVIDMPLRDVVKLIRGKKNTYVRLTVMRQTSDGTQTLKVTLKRETINLKEDAAKLTWVNKTSGDKKLKLAVIELPSFYGDMSQGSRSCYDDMKKLVDQAKAEKADGVILDLSKNGGGLLGEAVRIGGLFIRRGNVVATQDAKGSLDILSDEDESLNYNGPLVVLTSRLSASASEIVAGALQDYKRALIVGGDKTFGKGTVQAVSNLPRDLGAIKVTTGMFFIPAGESTQHRGVVADIALPSAFSIKDIGEQSLDYSLPPKSVSSFLSKEAQGSDKDSQWTPITKAMVEKLRAQSLARVSKDKEFDKIRTELAETEKRNGVIRLADALKKQKDSKSSKSENKGRRGRESDAKYLEQPQVKEGIEILTDLISLEASSTTAKR